MSARGWLPAFQHKVTGQILLCHDGYHDLEVLPGDSSHWHEWDTGFVNADGEYFTREQAVAELNLTGTGSGALRAKKKFDGMGTRMGAWGREEFKFIGVGEIVEQVRELETDLVFDPSGEDDREQHYRSVIWGRSVRWAAKKGKMVKIPRANVQFPAENLWNLEHAASIYQYMREQRSSMEPIRLPAGRVIRVTAKAVKQSEKFEAEGELDYQLGMTEPWTQDDVGTYEAFLVDGNHRAAAALAMGEPFIYVYCDANYLAEVRKKDLI